ncbi:MAG: hypothetical protein ACPGU5_05300 [Lishizhenia sp.]
MEAEKKIAVADSGGTKTKWLFDIDGEHTITIETDGLHPKELNDTKFQQLKRLLNTIKIDEFELHFYGAGCKDPSGKAAMENFLAEIGFKKHFVYSDLLGSCRACLGNKMGNVAILGTGAVGAHYSGDNVVITTSGLGYILGDEGSGFDLGKRLLRLYFDKLLPNLITQKIDAYFQSSDLILTTIYGSAGRKKIAGLAKIVKQYENTTVIRKLIDSSFMDFYKNTIKPLPQLDTIYLTGAVAHFFEDDLRQLLNEQGITVKEIIRNPAEVLLEYHK